MLSASQAQGKVSLLDLLDKYKNRGKTLTDPEEAVGIRRGPRITVEEDAARKLTWVNLVPISQLSSVVIPSSNGATAGFIFVSPIDMCIVGIVEFLSSFCQCGSFSSVQVLIISCVRPNQFPRVHTRILFALVPQRRMLLFSSRTCIRRTNLYHLAWKSFLGRQGCPRVFPFRVASMFQPNRLWQLLRKQGPSFLSRELLAKVFPFLVALQRPSTAIFSMSLTILTHLTPVP